MADRKTLFITGASTGIGAATARAAVAAGWNVALAARSRDKLDALVDEIGSEHALALTCDVTEFGDLEAAVAATVARFGPLHAVFANAGFGATRGFLEESPEQWRSMVLTNVLGAALTIRATMEAIVETKGHVLLTGSVAGRRPLPGSLYSSTKFAVGAMAESLRQELNGTGARVTLVAPGMVDTPFFDTKPEMEALHPEDVAGAVLWALGQPARVDVNDILIRPTAQEG